MTWKTALHLAQVRRPLRREIISGIGQVVVDDRVEWEMFLFEKIVESFGLREGAGEAVEQEAAVAMKAASAFADQVPDGGVWNECATTHEGERFGHGRRRRAIGAGCGAEDVAGGEMAGAEFFVEELRLRTFADAGSAEKNDTPGGSVFLSLPEYTGRPGPGATRRDSVVRCSWGNLCGGKGLRLGRERGWPSRQC